MDYIKKQILEIVRYAKSIGTGLNVSVNKQFEGRTMELESGKYLNFGYCDYLGLSSDIRLRQAAADASMQYGVYNAISRVFLRSAIYEEAETLISSIFKQPCLLVPRTTLGHIAALPTIVDSEDVMILDHQVHHSVNIAAQLTSTQGTKMEILRHSRMDMLEDKIKELAPKHTKVWYLADGIYSMYGDTIPVHEVMELLDRYSNFYLYVDDAHGMGWCGENGKGYVLSKVPFHPKLIITTSLGKGFGSGGGVIICPNSEVRERIEILGVPLMYTSPVTPSTLGSIIASAKIHKSDEIVGMQDQLKLRIRHFMNKSRELGLPLVGNDLSPIKFIASGKPDMTSDICLKMMAHGYFVTQGVFPAVPYNNSGVRIMITLNHTIEDIDNLLKLLQKEYEAILQEKSLKMNDITRFYKYIDFFDGNIKE
jgi:7-keto-8-aminopelargonate synthetase-like enzyme